MLNRLLTHAIFVFFSDYLVKCEVLGHEVLSQSSVHQTRFLATTEFDLTSLHLMDTFLKRVIFEKEFITYF